MRLGLSETWRLQLSHLQRSHPCPGTYHLGRNGLASTWNTKYITGFLGLTSNYRQYIEHYTDIAMLWNMSGNTPKVEGNIGWRCGAPRRVRSSPSTCNKQCQHAFGTLKMALGNARLFAPPDPQAKYCAHIDGSESALCVVLLQAPDTVEKVLVIFSGILHNAETQYPAYNRYWLGTQDMLLHWKFYLHKSEWPLLEHTDQLTMHWILTQPHLTVRQMDILTLLQCCTWEIKHILDVKNQVMDELSHHLDCRRAQCNVMALEVPEAGEWIDANAAGITENECLGLRYIHSATQVPALRHPLASTKEYKWLLSAQRFQLEENGLLWLRGDLEKEQMEIYKGQRDGGKRKEWKRCGDNHKGKREEGKRKSRDEMPVVYSKDDATTNPP